MAARFGSDFDISALADLTDAAYDALEPVRWPVTMARTGGRFFGDGRFFTPDGRARMQAVRPATRAADGALRLNTGRVRDQWHTMTRSGSAARLSAHMAEPYLEIHPEDAAARGIVPASIVEVTASTGTALLRALVTDRVRPGDAFAPIHWSGETAARACVSALVPPVVDPVSGQPASKSARVAARAWPAMWFAYAVSLARSDIDALPDEIYWAHARAGIGWQVEMAGADPVPDWEAVARRLLGVPEAELAHVGDPAQGRRRLAFRTDGCLAGALFVAPTPVALQRAHVVSLLGEASSPLAGRPAGNRPDPGPTVCACLSVGANEITACGADSVEAVGAATGAGTSCGSCRPEIATLLAGARLEAAE